MYTIKEAAGILGMTKPGIRYRITALKIPLNKDAFGRITLSDDDLQWIREGKKPERDPESSEKQEKEPERKAENTEKEPEETGKNQKEPESNVTAALVEMLRGELQEKDKQIENLSGELARMGERLDSAIQAWRDAQRDLAAAQALHAATVHQLQAAQEPENEQKEETRTRAGEDQPDAAHHKKRSWLDKILGRV